MTVITINDIDRKNLKIIAEVTNKTFKEIRELYNEKIIALKGMVSTEAIVNLIANDLSVDINEPEIIEKIEWVLKPKKKEGKDMSVWDDIDLSTNEFNPFLKVKNGIVYHLQLVDPSQKPRPSIDGYGNNQHIWEVKLLDLEPKKAFDDTDKEGKALFMKNKLYSFGMKKTSMRRFKELWESVKTVDKFTFKRIGSSFQTDYVFKEE